MRGRGKRGKERPVDNVRDRQFFHWQVRAKWRGTQGGRKRKGRAIRSDVLLHQGFKRGEEEGGIRIACLNATTIKTKDSEKIRGEEGDTATHST